MNFINVKIVDTVLTDKAISLVVNGSGESEDTMLIGPFGFTTETFSTILSIVGAESWETVKDSYMRLKIENENQITAIGNIIENRWVELVFNGNESNNEIAAAESCESCDGECDTCKE